MLPLLRARADMSGGGAAAAPAAPDGGADASLERYKSSLLGAGVVCAGAGGATCACGACVRLRDPRRVVVHALVLAVAGRPDVVLDVGGAAGAAALPTPDAPLVVREGAAYRTRVRVSVAHGVALGLTLTNVVSNSLGLVLDREVHALGSYPPGPVLDLDLPPAVWPSGFLARGAYRARTTLTDDDGAVHLDVRWAFEIARKWPEEA